ncbi:MAG: efflux RND transporter periplasmic adaptor subunit, partial [Reyranellaceae bacterium]
MNANRFPPTVGPAWLRSPLAVLAIALVVLLAGLLLGRWTAPTAPPAAVEPGAAQPETTAKVLYWYDPMRPEQHFDQPGKSPFMDMQLIPKYADADAGAGADAADTLRIDPQVAQNLGMRLATAVAFADSEHPPAAAVVATGLLGFNERQVAVLQTRSAGFVEWVKPLAEGDLVERGETVARLLLPDWVALQQELLALKANGDPTLLAAGRERLAAAGMSQALIERVLASGRIDNRIALNAPIGGVVTEVGLRAGMSAAAGTTVLAIRDIDEVWLEVAVPEAEAGGLAVGDPAKVRFAALPGRDLAGSVQLLLPTLDAAARSLRVRVALANPGHHLRPGMSAQVQLLGSRP